MAILIWDMPEGLRGTVEYSTDLFDESTIASMMDLFAWVLRQVMGQPELTVGQLVERMDQEDRQRRESQQAASKQRQQEKLRSLKARPRRRPVTQQS